MSAAVEPPFVVAFNLTRRCNLRCAHCYLDAGARDAGGPGELSTAEVLAVIERIASLSNETMIVLTGGEPLLRRDLETIARHAVGLGLMVVVGTNAVRLDDARVRSLQSAGVRALGISLDSLDAAHHDDFRGLPGAWRATMAGIDACRRAGLIFQIHFTVTDDNAHELNDVIAFARDAGAAVLNVFFIVCTGRGRTVSRISAERYESVLTRLVEAARDETGLIVRARCAPHFKRLARSASPPLPITLADDYDPGGCLAGTRYCRITPEGELTPCPYMELSAGSVREIDFALLWAEAPLFERLRSPVLEGRCGACEYVNLCGGCRARPLARDGNLMGEDFLCAYQPAGGPRIELMQRAAESAISWSDDAQARLGYVPPFIRRFVKQRAEAYVRERGEHLVTKAHLHALLQQRFGKPSMTCN